jgi:hypothetical protein
VINRCSCVTTIRSVQSLSTTAGVAMGVFLVPCRRHPLASDQKLELEFVVWSNTIVALFHSLSRSRFLSMSEVSKSVCLHIWVSLGLSLWIWHDPSSVFPGSIRNAIQPNHFYSHVTPPQVIIWGLLTQGNPGTIMIPQYWFKK